MKKRGKSRQKNIRKTGHWQSFGVCLILAVATLGLYWQTHSHKFIHYDDYAYITENPNVRDGFTWQGIKWACTKSYEAAWFPLTWFSHMLDCELFGIWPAGHHFTNVSIHILNTILLFIVLKYLTGAFWSSAIVAAIFALHPLRVESVAWAAERKDVLCTMFWILTMWAYAWYAKRPSIRRYLLTLGAFACGLLSKPMIVTLPFVLLLLDFWPLERFELSKNLLKDSKKTRLIGWLLLEKVPLIALSCVISVITFFVQQARGATTAIEIALSDRVANAIVSYIGYIGKMLWPRGLAIIYPHQGDNLSMLKILFSAIVLLAASAAVIYFSRRKKYLLVGWFWYLGTLVPVIGIIQISVQSMADRFTYIPMIGLYIMLAWTLADVACKVRWAKKFLICAVAAALAALSACTWNYLRYWKDSVCVFERALAVTGDNFYARNNYGLALLHADRTEEAVRHFEIANKLHPDEAGLLCNLASALKDLGRGQEALPHLQKSLQLNPDSAEMHNNMGNLLAELGKTNEAITHYRTALTLDPAFTTAHLNLADFLAKQNKIVEAVQHYRKIIELQPESIIAHGKLGLLLAKLNRIDEAIKEFQIVLTYRPDDAEMHRNIAFLYKKQGNITQAIFACRQAIRINPGDQKARNLLKDLLEIKN